MSRSPARLAALLGLVCACADEPSEGLPSDGGFTSGEETTHSTFPPVPSSTGDEPAETSGTTGDGPTSDPTAGTSSTSAGDPSSTGSSTGTPTSSESAGDSTTTDPTVVDGSTGEGNGESTGDSGPPEPGCGNDIVEPGEFCLQVFDTFEVAGTTPHDVVTGDFDGDGAVDVAVLNRGSENVSILLGDGAGALITPSTEYDVGTQPNRIRAADFDADGLDDLIVVNTGSDDVSVLLATGDGEFAPAVSYAVGDGPEDLGVGNLGNGTTIDFVVGNVGESTVHTGINPGTGVFDIRPADAGYPTGDRRASAVAIGEAGNGTQGDILFTGATDLAASPGGGNGDIGATIRDTADFGTDLRRADVGLVDADANVEVLLLDGARVLFLGNQDVPTVGFFPPVVLNAGTQPTEAIFGDVTGEGQLDVVVSDAGAGEVRVFVGDGTLTTFTPQTALPAGAGTTGVAVGDLDGDGVGDVVASNPAGTVTVILSDP